MKTITTNIATIEVGGQEVIGSSYDGFTVSLAQELWLGGISCQCDGDSKNVILDDGK